MNENHANSNSGELNEARLTAYALDQLQGQERAAVEAQRILAHSLQRGLSYKLYEGNVITMRPSLIIGKDEIDFIVATLREGLALI